MKKRLLHLCMFIATVFAFASCNDDDEVYYVTDTDIDGVYLGTMDVSAPFGEAGDLGAKDIKQKIYVKNKGNNQAQFQLKNFEFNGIQIGDLEINNTKVEKIENGFSFEGNSPMTLVVGGCEVKITGTISNSGNCQFNIYVDVISEGEGLNFIGLKVTVIFTGQKLAADKSSEALITAIDFNDPAIGKVNIQDNRIIFQVEEGHENFVFSPTITVSQGATISPASGVEKDFSSPVTYTVTSEDGIVTNKYIVMKNWTLTIDFEAWEITHSGTVGSNEQYELPEPKSIWGSTNNGIMTINDMVSSLRINLEYPVTSIENGYQGKGAIIKTLDTYLTIQGNEVNSSFGIPYNTAGSLFLGSFKTDMNDLLASTKFGIPYTGKPLTFSGYYKYTPGQPYREGKEEVNKNDEFAIYALLYEANAADGSDVTLIGDSKYDNKKIFKIDDSPYVVLRADVPYDGAKTEWTYFEIPFTSMNNKTYDPDKNYKITLVCTSSKDGANYNGGIGSTLMVDELKIIKE